MIEDKRSNSSGVEMINGCGNNEHAIYFEPDLLPDELSVYNLEILVVLLI